MSPLEQNIIRWALLLLSVLMVAGITYVYTNRNKQFTLIFTLLGILFVAIVEVISIVETGLHSHFLGKIDENNNPSIIAGPGWEILLGAWHIWILPVIFVLIIAALAIFFILRYQKKLKIADPFSSSQAQTSPSAKTADASATRAQRLSQFMVMDAAKKETRETNEKLAEALLTNAAYEIKISDLKARVSQLETELQETQKNLSEEIETLQLELNAKHRENDYISSQLSERTHELVRAQEMLEKLASFSHKSQKG
jgi:hypothetical protein